MGIEKEGSYPYQYNGLSEQQADPTGKGYSYETDWRGYDPQLGRFKGIDALADEMPGINPYQYSYNNPVMFNDPTGENPLLGALIGAGAGGVVGGVISVANGGNFWNGAWKGALAGAAVGAAVGWGVEAWGGESSALGTPGYMTPAVTQNPLAARGVGAAGGGVGAPASVASSDVIAKSVASVFQSTGGGVLSELARLGPTLATMHHFHYPRRSDYSQGWWGDVLYKFDRFFLGSELWPSPSALGSVIGKAPQVGSALMRSLPKLMKGSKNLARIVKQTPTKVDYLFTDRGQAMNWARQQLGHSTKNIYDAGGKLIGWSSSKGSVYWGHGDWGKGVGSSTFPHLNYEINGVKGHLFLENKIINRGMLDDFLNFFKITK